MQLHINSYLIHFLNKFNSLIIFYAGNDEVFSDQNVIGYLLSVFESNEKMELVKASIYDTATQL